MNVHEAISAIRPVKGVTSIIEGLLNNDLSVLPNTMGALTSTITEAEAKVEQYQKQLDDCKSDWGYWSILGDLQYWQSIVKILKSAELVGVDNLPNIPAPNLDGIVVMDAISRVSDFADEIFRQSKLYAQNKP